MHNMISSELFKIKKSKVARTMIVLYLLWAMIQIAIFVVLKDDADFIAQYGNAGSIFPVLGLISYLDGDLLYLLIGIFTSLIVCHDYSTGSIRQIISKGKGKVEYVISKYIAIVISELIFAAIYLTVVYVGSALVGKSFVIPKENITDILVFFLGAFISILAIVAVMLFFSFLFTKLSIALTINLLFTVIGALVIQLLYFATKCDSIRTYWIANMTQSFGDFEVTLAQHATNAMILVGCALLHH